MTYQGNINIDQTNESTLVDINQTSETTNINIEYIHEEITENTIIDITQYSEITNITAEYIQEDIHITISDSSTGAEEITIISMSPPNLEVNADWEADSGPTKILNLPSEFPPVSHSHTIPQINGLENELNNKATLVDGLVPASQLPSSLGIDKYYVHEQGVTNDEWNIVHNLEKYPSVRVLDSYGTEYEVEVRHISLNELTISFSIPFSGRAILN